MKYYSRMSLLALLAVIPFNGFSQEREVPIKYGDITKQPGFQSYMGLISGDRTQYTRNSKGKMVPIKEVGWADAGETPTHIVLQFDSSYGGAYVGSVGTTLWLDNVHVIY